MDNYKLKYIKYKNKYINLQKQDAGASNISNIKLEKIDINRSNNDINRSINDKNNIKKNNINNIKLESIANNKIERNILLDTIDNKKDEDMIFDYENTILAGENILSDYENTILNSKNIENNYKNTIYDDKSNANINLINRKLNNTESKFSNIKNSKILNGVWIDLPSELYVIGDIHGDFYALKQSLELTGCVIFDKIQHNNMDNIDGCELYKLYKNIRWNPEKKNCFIVFAGDIIDRCRHSPVSNIDCVNTINDENCDYQMLEMLLELDNIANTKYNSRVIIILGNHELLNIQNDTKYVSNKGKNDKNRLQNIKNIIANNINNNNLFGIIRINRYIIVHGGVNDIFFNELNTIFQDLLVKNPNLESIEIYNSLIKYYIKDNLVNNNVLEINDTIFFNNLSPFWDRTIGGLEQLNLNQCRNIFTHNILHVNSYTHTNDHLKIIVAHCPQFTIDNTINLVDCQEYKNRIYRIDIGMSRAFDFYKSFNELFDILKNINIIRKIDHKIFLEFTNNDKVTRVVSILQITKDCEKSLYGKLSTDYFYETIFDKNQHKEKNKFILMDIYNILLKNEKIYANNLIYLSDIIKCKNEIIRLLN